MKPVPGYLIDPPTPFSPSKEWAAFMAKAEKMDLPEDDLTLFQEMATEAEQTRVGLGID